MYSYVARQPIIDVDQQLFGYELLFRNSLQNVFPNINAHEATSKLLIGSHLSLGLDTLTDNYPAFINFPELSLLIRLPEILPKEQVVIELLEQIQPSPELIETCRELQAKGYRIALDDFAYKEEWKPVLPYVDIIKIDIQQSSPRQIFEIKKLKLEHSFDLLAEKVETHEEFVKMRDLGFRYFQGYFFARPEVIKKRALHPSQLNLMQLMALLAQPLFNFDAIHETLQRDLSLTYKLLRFVNSSFFGFQKEVTSTKQALVYLGETEIRKFLALLSAAKLAECKPEELIKMAIARARFCELLAEKQQGQESEAFLCGLFSLIGAILDEPLEAVMEKLPLGLAIKKAVLHDEGILASYLNLARCFEQGDWSFLDDTICAIGIKPEDVSDSYLGALSWCDALLKTNLD